MVTVAGVGCALADYLYPDVRFDAPTFKKYLSKQAGDGGLSPGRLVFTEELEKFAGKAYPELLHEITGGINPAGSNVGGPGLVSLVHAAQLLGGDDFKVRFFGCSGGDSTAGLISGRLKNVCLDISGYRQQSDKPTPFTDVFSDPTYDDGHGERTFVNNIGAAWDYFPEMVPEGFFNTPITCFGGTALVPNLHDNLLELLKKAKKNGCITIVNTVYDFRNEKLFPGEKWPLGKSDESFRHIDLLIMDREEALKISGSDDLEAAVEWFIKMQVSSFIITNGAGAITAWSDGEFIADKGLFSFPVTRWAIPEIRMHGDTTGCGDNFAGGAIAAIAWQYNSTGRRSFDLRELMAWAVASGGFACSYMGGAFSEAYPGEKLAKVRDIYSAYLKQLPPKK